jgi:hypothetical protein
MKSYTLTLDPPLYAARAFFSAMGLSVAALATRVILPDYWREMVAAEAWWLAGMLSAWAAGNLLAYVFDLRERAQRMPDEPVKVIPQIYQSVVPSDTTNGMPYTLMFEIRRFENKGITQAQLHILADRVVNQGKHMVCKEFIPHWRGFTRGDFHNTQEIFVEQKYARWEIPGVKNASINLYPDGVRFLKDVLAHTPPTDGMG